ncbi:541_t:CDS:1, partial [Scutellospora calospora]
SSNVIEVNNSEFNSNNDIPKLSTIISHIMNSSRIPTQLSETSSNLLLSLVEQNRTKTSIY